MLGMGFEPMNSTRAGSKPAAINHYAILACLQQIRPVSLLSKGNVFLKLWRQLTINNKYLNMLKDSFKCDI